jgi:hypothetical protein
MVFEPRERSPLLSPNKAKRPAQSARSGNRYHLPIEAAGPKTANIRAEPSSKEFADDYNLIPVEWLDRAALMCDKRHYVAVRERASARTGYTENNIHYGPIERARLRVIGDLETRPRSLNLM